MHCIVGLPATVTSIPCLNVVRPCCREAAALRGARHAKRGGATRLRSSRAAEMGHNVRQSIPNSSASNMFEELSRCGLREAMQR